MQTQTWRAQDRQTEIETEPQQLNTTTDRSGIDQQNAHIPPHTHLQMHPRGRAVHPHREPEHEQVEQRVHLFRARVWSESNKQPSGPEAKQTTVKHGAPESNERGGKREGEAMSTAVENAQNHF